MKAVVGKLSRRLQVRVLPGAPFNGMVIYNGRPGSIVGRFTVVGVAQLVEHRIVVPAVVGSIPIVHPRLAVGAASAAI